MVLVGGQKLSKVILLLGFGSGVKTCVVMEKNCRRIKEISFLSQKTVVIIFRLVYEDYLNFLGFGDLEYRYYIGCCFVSGLILSVVAQKLSPNLCYPRFSMTIL